MNSDMKSVPDRNNTVTSAEITISTTNGKE